MATWTDPAELKVIPGTGDYARSELWNKVVDDIDFLANPPSVALRLTSSQSVADATPHTVTWHVATWSGNGDTMWDDGAPDKATVQRAGPHLLIFCPEWESTVSLDDVTMTLLVNDETRDIQFGDKFVLETNLALADVLEMVIEQRGGAAVNLIAIRTRWTITWKHLPPSGGTPE